MTNHTHMPGARRILVVANGAVEAEALRRATGLRVGDERRAEVRVIAPALNSRLRHWVSDEDGARASAGARLAVTLEGLCAAGIEASGQVGDADPLQAIADELFDFRAEEIVLAAPFERRPHWATGDLVGQVRRRLARTVVHVVEGTEIGSSKPTRGRAGSVRKAASAVVAIYSAGRLPCDGLEANG